MIQKSSLQVPKYYLIVLTPQTINRREQLKITMLSPVLCLWSFSFVLFLPGGFSVGLAGNSVHCHEFLIGNQR